MGTRPQTVPNNRRASLQVGVPALGKSSSRRTLGSSRSARNLDVESGQRSDRGDDDWRFGGQRSDRGPTSDKWRLGGQRSDRGPVSDEWRLGGQRSDRGPTSDEWRLGGQRSDRGPTSDEWRARPAAKPTTPSQSFNPQRLTLAPNAPRRSPQPLPRSPSVGQMPRPIAGPDASPRVPKPNLSARQSPPLRPRVARGGAGGCPEPAQQDLPPSSLSSPWPNLSASSRDVEAYGSFLEDECRFFAFQPDARCPLGFISDIDWGPTEKEWYETFDDFKKEWYHPNYSMFAEWHEKCSKLIQERKSRRHH